MTDMAGTAPGPGTGADQAARSRWTPMNLIRATEIDLRLFGMVLALAAILLGFGFATPNFQFLEPVNLVTLSIQAASVAIIATGMVLVIVSRNIDLSVGSVVGVVAMTDAVLMSSVFPATIGVNQPFAWLLAALIGVLVGGLIGAFQGFIIAYIGVPSFIVTLGGLLAWRGVVWVIGGGATLSYNDSTFVLLGGGPEGSIGGPTSWIIGAIICVALVLILANSRRQRRRFGFPLRPMWAEVVLAIVGTAVVLGAVFVANAYHWPEGKLRQYAAAHPGFVIPPGGLEAGIPFPILILIIVTIA